MKRSIKKLFLLLLLVGSLVEAMALGPATDRYSIDIVCLKKVPIIEVKLNGKTAYFILDSGSDISLLNNKELTKYAFSLKNRATKDIKGISGERKAVYEVLGLHLQAADQLLETTFYATDLSPLVGALLNSTQILISGIIGMDLMRAYGFEIDYRNKKLYLGPAS